MADKSFGIRQLNLIGESGTANITSPNNLNLNASNVAISTDVTVGRHLDVDGHAEFDAVNVAGVSTFAGITTVSGPSLFTNQLSIAGVTTFSSAINVSSSYGTSGQVLTSQGSGSAPQWASAGKILQVVTTDYTGTFSTSTPNTFEQITGLNRSITLSSSSSRVLILLTIGQASTGNGASGSFAVTRSGTRILLGAAAGIRGRTSIKFYMHSSSHSYGFSFIGVDSPGASGSYTYGAQASAQGGETLYVNRTQINSDLTDSYEHRAASHLTLMEIAS
jgi:hypothetical protein